MVTIYCLLSPLDGEISTNFASLYNYQDIVSTYFLNEWMNDLMNLKIKNVNMSHFHI